MSCVAITGATGFVGRELLAQFVRRGWTTIGLVRGAVTQPLRGVEYREIGELPGAACAAERLKDVEVLVHAAARVHVMSQRDAKGLAGFRHINVEGSLNLARAASAAGVKRMVYLSSVKVNGECTPPGRPFRPDDLPNPGDAYAVSKAEAEAALAGLSRPLGLEMVFVRPPLVYGPGVKANFSALLRLVAAGVPLPLASVDNRRSLVALANLGDFIFTTATHPAAAGRTFLVSDGVDLSTPELVRRIAAALGRPARLFPAPVSLLKFGGAVVGATAAVHRLCESLQADISSSQALVGWTPPVKIDDALVETVRHWRTR